LNLPVPTVLIENAAGSGAAPSAGTGLAIRKSLGLDETTPVVLYTGTFEAYQGLDLLFESMKRVVAARPAARLVMVGGEPAQVETARQDVARLGLSSSVLFTGQRPAAEVPAYLDAATTLVSPRSSGTNTPLKIYQYLRAGRPIVATRLRTHTQVLSDDVAILTAATPEGLGDGILQGLTDGGASGIGDRARALAETKYSDEAYVEKTRRAYEILFQ
jgi:glycosyltransferase involved in cell wall biosynthesis